MITVSGSSWKYWTRKELIEKFEQYFENLNSSIPGFITGYKEGLSKSHFHVPCYYCKKPMHFDESDGSWSKILPEIESLLRYVIKEKIYEWTDDRENEFLDYPSSFEQYTNLSELYKLSYIIGQEHEHLRLYDKENGSVIHFDQNNKNWGTISYNLAAIFMEYYHPSCYDEHKRESEQDQDLY